MSRMQSMVSAPMLSVLSDTPVASPSLRTSKHELTCLTNPQYMVWGKCLCVSVGLRHGSPHTCVGCHLFYKQKEWEPHMGLHSDGSSCALGMCLAVYVPQLILQEISGTVWV